MNLISFYRPSSLSTTTQITDCANYSSLLHLFETHDFFLNSIPSQALFPLTEMLTHSPDQSSILPG